MIKFPDVIDATICKAWHRCPRAAFHSYFEGKRKPHEDESVDLVAGGAFAYGLEVARKNFFFHGASAEAAIERGIAALASKYGPERPDEKKSLAKVQTAFLAYLQRWPLSFDEGIVPTDQGGVEVSFQVPTGFTHPDNGTPLMYAGRFDLQGIEQGDFDPFNLNPDGQLWGCDEKTTGKFAANFIEKWMMDWQMLGYIHSMRKLGVPMVGMKVRGIALTAHVKFNLFDDLKETRVYPVPAVLDDWERERDRIVSNMIGAYQTAREMEAKTGTFDYTVFPQFMGDNCHKYNRACSFLPLCTHVPVPPDYEIHFWNPTDQGEGK